MLADFSRIVRGALLKCLNAARGEEALRIRERALRQTRLGQRCLVDFSKIEWRTDASLILGDDVHFAGAIGFAAVVPFLPGTAIRMLTAICD